MADCSKSVTLDEWTREQLNSVKEMGNIKSNAIYNPDESRHPPPTTISADERDSDLTKYIRRKYELGAFKRAAPKALAESNAITSRAIARDARAGHVRPPLQPEELPRRDRDLPALPISPTRQRPTVNGPVWNNLQSSSSQAAQARPAPLNRAASTPVVPSSHPQQANLIDVEGSTTSTRPLQLSNFPTVPAWQPQGLAPLPLNSPGGAISPLALGQQAFFTHMAPTATGNPFMAQMSPSQMSPQNGYFAQQIPSMQQQMGMGGMNNMGNAPMGGMNGMPMGGSMNPDMGMPMGMGMNTGMGMSVPAGTAPYGQQQYQQWNSYGVQGM